METVCRSDAIDILQWRRVGRVSIYGWVKRRFSSPKLWVPSSLLFSAHVGFFPRRKSGREMLCSKGKSVLYLNAVSTLHLRRKQPRNVLFVLWLSDRQTSSKFRYFFYGTRSNQRSVTHLIYIEPSLSVCLSEEECQCVNVTDVFSAASLTSLVSDINLRLTEVVRRTARTHARARTHTNTGMKFPMKKPTSENNTLTVLEMPIQSNGSGGFDLLFSLDFRLTNDFKTKNTNATIIFRPFYVLH